MRITSVPLRETDPPVVVEDSLTTMTVTRTPSGWTIEAVNKILARNSNIDDAYVFTAEITACPCDRPACACDKTIGSGKCRDHCHKWHAERVLKLAQRLWKSY